MAISVLESVANTLRETIEPGINSMIPELDTVVPRILKSSMGVVRDQIGRGWLTKMVYSGGVSGGHTWVNPLADSTGSMGSATAGVTEPYLPQMYGEGTGWPGILEMTAPNYLTRTVKLCEGRGSMPLPIHLIRSDMLDSSIGSVVAEIAQQTSRLFALKQINSFWKLNRLNSIGTFTGSSFQASTTVSSAQTLTSGRIRSFYRGQIVDLYSESSSLPNALLNDTATTGVIVADVDYLAKTLTFITKSGSTTSTSGVIHILPHNALVSGPNPTTQTAANMTINYPMGLLDWVKPSGVIMGETPWAATSTGGIDLASAKWFKSIVSTSMSGALTSDILNKHIGGFLQAYGFSLDTIITTTGVLLGFLENLDSNSQLLRYESQGKALDVKAGWDGFGYVFEGKPYRLITSPNCFKGEVFVTKLGENNIRKFVPPRLKDAGRDSRFEGEELEFMGPVFGFKGITVPAYGGTTLGLSDRLTCPVSNWCQFAPKKPQSIRIGTFTENVYEG